MPTQGPADPAPPDPAPYDRLFLGDIVTPGAVLPGGYVAIRGETIAAIGQEIGRASCRERV